LNHDGSKLSKRQNDVRVESYKLRGIMPLALINFISKAGGGFKDLDLDTIYSQDELTQKVSFCCRISINFWIQFLLFLKHFLTKLF
jgi:glutamyl/glutaminyl-tRNA synthetase